MLWLTKRHYNVSLRSWLNSRLPRGAAPQEPPHEDHPAPDLRRNLAGGGLRAAGLPVAVFLLRLRRRAAVAGQAIARWNPKLVYEVPPRPALRGPAHAQPHLRAAAHLGADRLRCSCWRGWPRAPNTPSCAPAAWDPGARCAPCWAWAWCSWRSPLPWATTWHRWPTAPPSCSRPATRATSASARRVPGSRSASPTATSRSTWVRMSPQGELGNVRIFEFNNQGSLVSTLHRRHRPDRGRRLMDPAPGAAARVRHRWQSLCPHRAQRTARPSAGPAASTAEMVSVALLKPETHAHHRSVRLHPPPGSQRADRAALRNRVLAQGVLPAELPGDGGARPALCLPALPLGQHHRAMCSAA